MADLERLRELAEAATPGEWKCDGSHIYAAGSAIIAQVHNAGSRAGDYPLVANRDFMTAASPATILSLISELEAMALELLVIAEACEENARDWSATPSEPTRKEAIAFVRATAEKARAVLARGEG